MSLKDIDARPSAKQDADSRARAEAEAKAKQDAAAGHSKDLHDKARKLTPLHKVINKLKNKHTKATLEQTTDCLYDIYEKKLIADEADVKRSGRVVVMMKVLLTSSMTITCICTDFKRWQIIKWEIFFLGA